MSQLLNAYFAYMESPREGLEKLFRRRAYGVGLSGYLMAALASVCVFNMGEGIGVFSFLYKTLVLFIAEVLIGALMAACAALFLDWSGRDASPARLFVLIGTAGFIKGLLIAGAIVFLAVPVLHYLMPLLVLLVLVLQLGYLTRNVARLYQVSAARACVAVLFCAAPALVAALLAMLFLVWGIFLLF